MRFSSLGCFMLRGLPLLPAFIACSDGRAHDFSGYYVGALGGGVYSHFNSKTSTQAGTTLDAVKASQVNHAGNQNLYENGFITGIEGGYNWQFNHFLVGLESDIQALSINSKTNSGSNVYSNDRSTQFVIYSYGNDNWLFTARPRIGYVRDNWLIYATGGLALTLLQGDFSYDDSNGKFESSRVSDVKPGYVVGAGVETAVTEHVSMKAEYRFMNVDYKMANQQSSSFPKSQVFSSEINLNQSMLELGLAYHFNNQPNGLLYTRQMESLLNSDRWQTELGVRAFASSGVDGMPQPLFNSNGTQLFSRLIFNNLTAYSGETFGRIEHASGVYLKGFLGAGSITDGELNDEDFPAGGAYSNTSSDAKGNLSYAVADAGYSFINTPFGKTGAFIGYGYNAENINVYGCKQLAGATVCVPNIKLRGVLGITQDERYNSMRVGINSRFDITELVSMTTDVAYLPYVNLTGQDNHLLRQLVISERSNLGNGAMLETVLGYQFAHNWNVGLGARYWMWNMHTGTVNFNFQGVPGSSRQVTWYNTERYGLFLQLNYGNKKSGNAGYLAAPVDWKGIYAGGHLGGAWGNTRWRDPFPTTPLFGGLADVAGFGDKVQSTGPLGGGDVYLNWQTGNVVYGFGGTLSVADVRGNNTLFSGLGGVNGEVINDYLGTIVGRLGAAHDRSLFYVNGGTAVLNTKYSINANTSVSSLGAEGQKVTHWGWTAGVGVEYALTDNWTTSVEYDYINIPRNDITFSTITTINAAQLAVDQTMNIFKLGLSYKLRDRVF